MRRDEPGQARPVCSTHTKVSSVYGPSDGAVAPCDPEAERSVLGAILLGAAEGSLAPLDAIRGAGLTAGDFYLPEHGAIFAAMIELAERGTVPDVLALTAELERTGKLDAAGGKARLAELAKLAPATANAAHYARLVLDAAEPACAQRRAHRSRRPPRASADAARQAASDQRGPRAARPRRAPLGSGAGERDAVVPARRSEGNLSGHSSQPSTSPIAPPEGLRLGFWRAPRWLPQLLEDRVVTPTGFALLTYLAVKGADREEGLAVSYAALAAVLDCTTKTVSRALKRLRDAELVDYTIRQGQRSPFRLHLGARVRWGFERAHAYRLLQAAQVAAVLSPMGDIPGSERQARELVPLLRDERELIETWRELRAEYGDRLTAEKVRQVVSERLQVRGGARCRVQVDAAEHAPGRVDVDGGCIPLVLVGGDEHADRAFVVTVRAIEFYDQAADGLAQPWSGRVFCNPPYGGRLAGLFAQRLIDEYEAGNVTAAVLLVNAHGTDTDWFRPFLRDYYPLCFTDHRIDFDSAGREKGSGSTHGSAFCYLGPEPERFAAVFASFGTVLRRWPDEAAA